MVLLISSLSFKINTNIFPFLFLLKMHRRKLKFVLLDNYVEEGLNWLIQSTTPIPIIAIQLATISQVSPLLYGQKNHIPNFNFFSYFYFIFKIHFFSFSITNFPLKIEGNVSVETIESTTMIHFNPIQMNGLQ